MPSLNFPPGRPGRGHLACGAEAETAYWLTRPCASIVCDPSHRGEQVREVPGEDAKFGRGCGIVVGWSDRTGLGSSTTAADGPECELVRCESHCHWLPEWRTRAHKLRPGTRFRSPSVPHCRRCWSAQRGRQPGRPHAPVRGGWPTPTCAGARVDWLTAGP